MASLLVDIVALLLIEIVAPVSVEISAPVLASKSLCNVLRQGLTAHAWAVRSSLCRISKMVLLVGEEYLSQVNFVDKIGHQHPYAFPIFPKIFPVPYFLVHLEFDVVVV